MKRNLTRATDVSPNPKLSGDRLKSISLYPLCRSREDKDSKSPGRVLQLGISSWATDKQTSGRQISQRSWVRGSWCEWRRPWVRGTGYL